MSRTFILFALITLSSSCIILNGCKGQGKPVSVTPSPGEVVAASENSAVTFTISDYFNGFNAQMMRGPSWKAPGFAERVNELHPGLIRYPGGTVASYWDWKTGWLMKGIPLRKGWTSITEESPITIDDLKYACDHTSAKPLFVLNMMTSDLTYQIEMLNYAKQLGLPVEFVELDNEIYLGEEFYVKKFPDGKAYALACNEWISAIKKQFPGVKIAVVGNSIREGAAKKEKPNAQRERNWNHDVLSEIKNADGMTFHVYGGGGLNYLGVAPADEGDAESADKAKAMQQTFNKKESIAYTLSIPFIRWKSAKTYDYQMLPSDIKPWITEYNLFEKEGVVAGTWAHGLYALMQTLLFMENPKTELICYHNLTTTAQFAAIFNTKDGFSKSVKKKPTDKFGFTAAGFCLALSGKAMMAGGKATKLKFSSEDRFTAIRGQEFPSLNAWKIETPKGIKIIVANLSESPVTCDFATVAGNNVSYEQINAEPHVQIGSEQDVNRQKGHGSTIKLAAYSVTLIEGE